MGPRCGSVFGTICKTRSKAKVQTEDFDYLKARCGVKVDLNVAEHLQLVKTLWDISFPDTAFEIPHENWKEIGF